MKIRIEKSGYTGGNCYRYYIKTVENENTNIYEDMLFVDNSQEYSKIVNSLLVSEDYSNYLIAKTIIESSK